MIVYIYIFPMTMVDYAPKCTKTETAATDFTPSHSGEANRG